MGPEKRFENEIKEYLESKGIWFVKFFANRMTKKGIPDLLVCANGYFIAIEVKREDGKPSKLQIKKCKEIRMAGGFSFIVYPSGFNKFKEIIDQILDDSCEVIVAPLIIKEGNNGRNIKY